MPAISRIWAGSALISAGLQPQQGNLEPGRLVSAIGLLIPQCRPGRTTKTPRLQGNLSRRSRSYGHSMGVNTPARKSALATASVPAMRRVLTLTPLTFVATTDLLLDDVSLGPRAILACLLYTSDAAD